jgi:superfamily II DNA or RNA helicase
VSNPPTNKLEDRAYQQEAKARVQDAWWNRAIKRVLIAVATGGGKTAIFLDTAIDELNEAALDGRHARVMILAHQIHLIEQPVMRLRRFFPAWQDKVGVVQAGNRDYGKPIVVCSVQTVRNPSTLAKIIEAGGPFTILIIDEAHHAVAEGHMTVLSALEAAYPDLRVLGCTATPKRTDRDGLSKVFQECVYKWTIKDGIKTGFLVPIKALAVQTGISLKSVKKQAGDFKIEGEGGLRKVFETDNCFELVVASHKKYAGDRKCIAFTVSVDGAYELAAKFNEAGVSAVACDGTTPMGRRDPATGQAPEGTRTRILDDFRAGAYQVLVNCFLWTEGLDIPELACCHWVRPTTSDLIYIQAIGRVLRPCPEVGKEDALVLDYAPLEYRDIVMAGDVLGKPREQRQAEAKAREAGVILEGFSHTGEGNGIDGDPDEILTRQLSYLTLSPHSWHLHDGWATLGLGRSQTDKVERTLVITPPKRADRMHRLLMIARGADAKGPPEIAPLRKSADWDSLAEFGQEIAERHGSGSLTRRDREWMRRPITEAQKKLFLRLYADHPEVARVGSLTAGDAARLITHQLALLQIRAFMAPAPGAQA